MTAPPASAGAPLPRLALTMGDPRGIGPEVMTKALADAGVRAAAEYVLVGPEGALPEASSPGTRSEAVGRWSRGGSEALAGRLSARAIERAVELALRGEVDGLVTGPVSKRALAAAGWEHPGHTEYLRDRSGVREVTMMMVAERTPLGGPLRLALLTVHIPLRRVFEELSVERIVRRASVAASALREWWEIPRPRIAWASLNPHASEDGLFGDEEQTMLEPAAQRVAAETGSVNLGVFPADTVFRRCLAGQSDLVIVPYHDVGLGVLKTIAPESGVNVTAGLPFPRTSPDHGTAFDIAGRDVADPRSTMEAVRLCARFCRARAALPR